MQFQLPARRIPVNIITGFLGTGKTTAIRELLKQVPAGEKWAVLVNEFGEIGIDGALLQETGAVIKEVAGGCVCCTTSPFFRIALVRLLRETKPDRLLIEPSGLAHPVRILETLREPEFTAWLDLRATLCLIDPQHLGSEKHTAHPTFQDQALFADVLLAAKADRCKPDELSCFTRFVENFSPPKTANGMIKDGLFPASLLDLPSRHLAASRATTRHLSNERPIEDSTSAAPELPEKQWQHSQGMVSLGFRQAPDCLLDESLVIGFLLQHQPVRAKGIIHSPSGWREIQFTEGCLSIRECAQSTASRFEVIDTPTQNWQAIELTLDAIFSAG